MLFARAGTETRVYRVSHRLSRRMRWARRDVAQPGGGWACINPRNWLQKRNAYISGHLSWVPYLSGRRRKLRQVLMVVQLNNVQPGASKEQPDLHGHFCRSGYENAGRSLTSLFFMDKAKWSSKNRWTSSRLGGSLVPKDTCSTGPRWMTRYILL